MKKAWAQAGVLSISILCLYHTSAFAQARDGLGGILDNVRTDTLGPAGDFIGAATFILGLIAAVTSVYKLVQGHRNPHDPSSRPQQAILWGVVAACLIAIPSFLGMGVTTFFGSGADTTSIDGSLRSIN